MGQVRRSDIPALAALPPMPPGLINLEVLEYQPEASCSPLLLVKNAWSFWF